MFNSYRVELILDPVPGVQANVELVIDSTNADNVDTSMDILQTQLEGVWEVEMQGK